MEHETKNKESEYIGVQQVANILGISYCCARDNIIPNVPHIRAGRKILVHEGAFRQYLKRLEKQC